LISRTPRICLIEIAYFDRGPLDKEKRGAGGFWSVYWYNGYIYGSEIARGLDVFKLVPSKFLTQNEIDAANQVHFDELNVQNQPKITWPANFVVSARLSSSQLDQEPAALPHSVLPRWTAAIEKVEASRSSKDASSTEEHGRNSSKGCRTANRLPMPDRSARSRLEYEARTVAGLVR